MTPSSIILSAQPSRTDLRSELRDGDADAVTRIVARSGVFSAAEVAIARSLVEETRAGAPGADYLFLFADGPDGLEGYTCYGPIPGTDKRYELYWIAVDPDVARQGLGRTLLTATEDVVRALGGTHLFAHTSSREDYAPARTFYARNGYAQLAAIADYYSDGDGLVICGKSL